MSSLFENGSEEEDWEFDGDDGNGGGGGTLTGCGGRHRPSGKYGGDCLE